MRSDDSPHADLLTIHKVHKSPIILLLQQDQQAKKPSYCSDNIIFSLQWSWSGASLANTIAERSTAHSEPQWAFDFVFPAAIPFLFDFSTTFVLDLGGISVRSDGSPHADLLTIHKVHKSPIILLLQQASLWTGWGFQSSSSLVHLYLQIYGKKQLYSPQNGSSFNHSSSSLTFQKPIQFHLANWGSNPVPV